MLEAWPGMFRDSLNTPEESPSLVVRPSTNSARVIANQKNHVKKYWRLWRSFNCPLNEPSCNYERCTFRQWQWPPLTVPPRSYPPLKWVFPDSFWANHITSQHTSEWISHRKRRETKQQPSMLPGPAVPGCCFVSFCFMCDIHSVYIHLNYTHKL